MNDYLAKPIDEQKLSRLLARYSPVGQRVLPSVTEVPASRLGDGFKPGGKQARSGARPLQMLVEFLPEVQKLVELYSAENNTSALRNIIHKLHGSASYSGVPE